MKQVKRHFSELTQYPQKILILAGIIIMLVGVYTTDKKVEIPTHVVNYSLILFFGLVISILGVILYLIKIFPKKS